MKNIKTLVSVALLLIASHFSSGQTLPVGKDGVAIGGYDVVGYFTDGKAIKGSKEFSYRHKDVIYYFINAGHKAAFAKSPDNYIPQYDGYCAWAVGEKNAKFPIDPETFKVTDGKLYLFYNGPVKGKNFNALEPWVSDENNLHTKAESNWPALKKSK